MAKLGNKRRTMSTYAHAASRLNNIPLIRKDPMDSPNNEKQIAIM